MSNNKLILTKLENMEGWLKSIDKQVKITNGQTTENKTEIKLIKQRLHIEKEVALKIETWSRKKLLFFGSIIIILIQIIAEVIKHKIG